MPAAVWPPSVSAGCPIQRILSDDTDDYQGAWREMVTLSPKFQVVIVYTPTKARALFSRL